MKIRTILPLIISILILMVMGLAGMGAYEARQIEKEAEHFVSVNEISSLLLKSTASWALERGVTNKALAASENETPETHDKIVKLRETSDHSLKEALSRLQGVAEMKNSQQVVAAAQEAFQSVQAIRAQADSDLTKPEAGRDAAVVSNFVPTITKLIDQVNVLRLTLETVVRPPVAQTMQLVTLRHLTAEMAEYAGRERARVSAIIQDKRPMKSEDIAALSTGRGHIELAWPAISVLRARPDTSPEVVTAINDAESAYFQTYGDLRKQIFSAGESGNYPISSKDYFDQVTTAINSILKLSTTMGDVAGAAAEANASKSGKKVTPKP